MAVRIWKEEGFTDSDFSTGGNWEGGTAPQAGDDVYFTKGSNNVDGTDESGTALGNVYCGKNYTGTIGSLANYLILDCARLAYNGKGDAAWVSLQNGGSDVIVVVGPDAAFSTVTDLDAGGLHLKTSSTDDINPLRIRGGKTRVESGARLALCDAMAGLVDIDSVNTAQFTTLRAFGTAQVTTNTDPGTSLTVANSAVVGYSGSATTAAVTMWGGILNWTGSADITTLTGYAGSFDGRNSTGDWTITNQVVTYEAVIDLRTGLGQPTLTAGYEIRGGGSVLVDAGAGQAVTYE